MATTELYIGAEVLRKEDPELVTGQASFIDNHSLPGMLWMAMVRPPYVHARVNSIDTSAAASMPGVVGVYTAADLDVGGLPFVWPITEDIKIPVHYPLTKDKIRFHGDAVAVVLAETRREALDAAENVSVDAFITKYIKLAQIQSGFIIKEDGTVQELVPPDQNPRFTLVREVIEETTGKVIVPYLHRYTYRLLSQALAEYSPAYIIGNMEPTEIQRQKDIFNNDPNCRVILVQTRAGKYGHTLLGGEDLTDKCSTMVFAENSYSLDDRSQIEDRMHRHGQTQSCLYIDVWGTRLDHKVTMALQAKESIAQAVFQHFGKKR